MAAKKLQASKPKASKTSAGSGELPPPRSSFLQDVGSKDPHQTVEIKTRVRISPEQAEAFKALPKDLQVRLGPPVYGQVMSAQAMRKFARKVAITETSSTIMCPW